MMTYIEIITYAFVFLRIFKNQFPYYKKNEKIPEKIEGMMIVV